ncbi:hypothetical protein QTH90_24190 [Variovorax sp. J2P1-59]|uniref:hypothetical protein n=1 Tax=Variovorax flavidus TaxID=3053501 RepID=UPI002575B7A5|nr:hypothetical protein [Variovorax sp. J2P1-59]MDM0077528.1 hypothetical protein [Variovorax sp. J2P1-59]
MCALGIHIGAAAQQAANDADRIPSAVLQDAEEPLLKPQRIGPVYVELNMETADRRKPVVPIASTAPSRQVARGIVDARAEWPLRPDLSARLSGRAGLSRTRDGATSRDEQFDLREAAVQWRASDRDVIEAGRIHVRSGAALGYNPTDYFKSRSAVDYSTRDPEVQRNNRLGTVMVAAQRIDAQSAVMLALAPKLANPKGLADEQPTERLRLADTNGEDRLLLKAAFDKPSLWSPELLAFKDSQGWRFGTNLTQGIGQQTTLFVEYSGGRSPSLMQQALRSGVALGDLPPSALAMGRARPGESWQHDVAIGTTWTGSSRLSLSAQLNYHQAGFDSAEWQRWLAAGASGPQGAGLAWYVRSYANAMQEPLSQRSLFLRAQWDQLGFRDLNASAFLNRSLDDQSWLFQMALEYRLSPASRLRGMFLATGGDADSLYGSDPVRRAFLLSFTHFL